MEIAFPPDREAQLALIARLVEARNGQRQAIDLMGSAMMAFNNAIDGRGDEALPEINDGEEIALEEA